MSRRPISEEVKIERRKERINTLKGLIFPVVLTLIIGVGVYITVNYQGATKEVVNIPIESYAGDTAMMVLENENLKFEFDPTTTQFDVTVKSSGKVWHSTPENAENDAVALTEEKAKLQSTLLLEYANDIGLRTELNSKAFSVDNGIYDVEKGDDYIRVNYSLGRVEKEYIIPSVTTESRFNQFMDASSAEGRNFVKQYYKKYDINKLGKKDNKEELIEKYPIIESEVIYILRDSANENVKKSIQKYLEEAGYNYDEFMTDKEYDSSVKTSDKPVFTADVIYRLDGNDLTVEVPMASFEYRDEYPIYTITILPYFGAGSAEDEGFLLVPEGGGALINFNNNKLSQSAYYANLYGWDMCISREAIVHNTRAFFNAFGISNNNDSFVCTIDNGSSYAAVQANISGKLNNYNYANANISICQREKFEVSGLANSDIYSYVESLPEDESIIQRYSFVDSGSYVDMAKDYQAYLKNRYPEAFTLNDDASTPVMVELIGAVDKVKQIAGVPVSRPLALTTYNEAADVVSELVNNDKISNLSVKYSGWCNGGVKQQVLNNIKLIHDLGSKSDFTGFVKTADELGVDLYLNGITNYAKNSNIFDGFFSFTDAAKLLSRERCELSDFSAVTYAKRENQNPYFLLHTDLAFEMADNLTEFTKKNNTNVSFEDIGMDLSSDFYRKDVRSRERVMNSQIDMLKNLSMSGEKVMINMGNDYAIPYVDFVTNMDLKGSEYTIIDEFVPFYQLAIHGFVNYTGDSINICGNDEEEVLKSAEYGAGLGFTLMADDSFTLQKTLYTQYYGSGYEAWHDKMVGIYERFNTELGHVYNQEMTGHENLTDTLSVTTYADGTKVYVNYGYDEITLNNVNVKARDYAVTK